MKELNMIEDQVHQLSGADEPDEDFDCYYGCITLKEELVSSLRSFSCIIF